MGQSHGLFVDMSLLLEGVAAWERGDHVKAAHVLIPQIERGLRKVADSIGVPITKPHPTIPGTSVAIGMGESYTMTKSPKLWTRYNASFSGPVCRSTWD